MQARMCETDANIVDGMFLMKLDFYLDHEDKKSVNIFSISLRSAVIIPK